MQMFLSQCPNSHLKLSEFEIKALMQVQLNLLNKIQNNYVGKEVKRSTVFAILS